MQNHFNAIEAAIVASGEDSKDAIVILKDIANKLEEDYTPGTAKGVQGSLIGHFEALALAIQLGMVKKSIASYKGVAALVLLNNLAEKVNVAFKSDTTSVNIPEPENPDEDDSYGDSYGGESEDSW